MPFALGIFGWIRLAGLLGVGFAGLLTWSSVKDVIRNYSAMSATIERLEHDKALLESRLTSYNLRIERRDAAIDASRCKEQIKRWVTHPDETPKPFNPFNQLPN